MITRLKAGQSILEVLTVRNWNQIIEAAERIQQLDALIAQLKSSLNGKSSCVLVNNDTGSDLDQYSIVRLDGLLFSDAGEDINTEQPANRQPFSGKSIDSDLQWHKLAIFQTPVKSGDPAPAVITGVSYALVDVSDASHIRAFPDGTSCKSGAGPLRILACSGSGSKPAIVVFDYGTQHYLAKASSNIAAGASGTVKVWDGSLTDIEITVDNVSSSDVTAGHLLGIQEESSKGSRYVNWEECSDET